MRYTIRVITYNRPDSLRRLLNSLAQADWRGQVTLQISIDGSRTASVSGVIPHVHCVLVNAYLRKYDHTFAAVHDRMLQPCSAPSK
jgi:GT2 family glycosyltransferase